MNKQAAHWWEGFACVANVWGGGGSLPRCRKFRGNACSNPQVLVSPPFICTYVRSGWRALLHDAQPAWCGSTPGLVRVHLCAGPKPHVLRRPSVMAACRASPLSAALVHDSPAATSTRQGGWERQSVAHVPQLLTLCSTRANRGGIGLVERHQVAHTTHTPHAVPRVGPRTLLWRQPASDAAGPRTFQMHSSRDARLHITGEAALHRAHQLSTGGQ